ncbi:MAG TPA: right-handed parallel beta-helix repeat-containing protein [Candidatus Kapabacteria bacterium]|nr:right-handed parallel beta-helix repeat-containing protein [Candidatus Kapabacteria bacterium]
MKIHHFLLMVIVAAAPLGAQTTVSGVIDAATIWTLAGSPYHVSGDITIARDASLTIEPGVEVRFASATGLRAEGPLIVEGSATARIRFVPASGSDSVDWKGISIRKTGATVFDSTTSRIGGSLIRNVEIIGASVGLNVFGGGIIVDSSLFEHNEFSLAFANTRHAFIRGNIFRDNYWGEIVTASFEPGDVGYELYDTRIIGNEIYGGASPIRLEVRHQKLTYFEFAYNRLRRADGLTVSGMVPGDVQSVHIHHNLIESLLDGLVLQLRPAAGIPVTAQRHVLVEKNIISGGKYAACLFGGDGVIRTHFEMNSIADFGAGALAMYNGLRTLRSNTFVDNGFHVQLGSGGIPGDSVTVLQHNVFGSMLGYTLYTTGNVRVVAEENDFIGAMGIAVWNGSGNRISAVNSYWGNGADERSVRKRLTYDSVNAPVDYLPMAGSGYWRAPLLRPDAVHIRRDLFDGGWFVTWSPSPDPRVTGYRVHYGRGRDGRFAYSEAAGLDSIFTVNGPFRDIAVTAVIGGAGGELDQLEGRESWFAFPEEPSPSSVPTMTSPRPLKLDLR